MLRFSPWQWIEAGCQTLSWLEVWSGLFWMKWWEMRRMTSSKKEIWDGIEDIAVAPCSLPRWDIWVPVKQVWNGNLGAVFRSPHFDSRSVRPQDVWKSNPHPKRSPAATQAIFCPRNLSFLSTITFSWGTKALRYLVSNPGPTQTQSHEQYA